tara:strand:- start:247 stop:438 length:192 start_codon:yes stop_codon:yes gene_type:complete
VVLHNIVQFNKAFLLVDKKESEIISLDTSWQGQSLDEMELEFPSAMDKREVLRQRGETMCEFY